MKMGDLIRQLTNTNFDYDAECWVEDDMLVVQEDENKKMCIKLNGVFEIPKAKNVNSKMPMSKLDTLIAMFISYVGRTSYRGEWEKSTWYEFWKQQTGYKASDYPIDEVDIDEI